jgi:hypothetical protein
MSELRNTHDMPNLIYSNSNSNNKYEFYKSLQKNDTLTYSSEINKDKPKTMCNNTIPIPKLTRQQKVFIPNYDISINNRMYWSDSLPINSSITHE